MYYYYMAVYFVSFLFFIIELFFHHAARSKMILIITSSILYCIINRHQTYTVVRLCCPEICIYTLQHCRLLSIVIILLWTYTSTYAVFCVRANGTVIIILTFFFFHPKPNTRWDDSGLHCILINYTLQAAYHIHWLI